MVLEITIALLRIVAVLAMVMVMAGIYGWFERKVSALMQDRIGANRAAVFGFAGAGLINTMLADPLKFATKEDFLPAGVDRVLHTLAPCIGMFAVVVAFAALPFGDVVQVGERQVPLQAVPLNVGILYILAMLSLSVYGVVLGGWASNNRFSFLGGIRGSAQMISYELAMGLSLVAMVMTYGTINLQEMVQAQGHMIGGWLPAWGIFYQPLAFLLFLTAGIAETKRAPFDLPEGESELVSGYFTEYSGMKYLMFFMSDFIEVGVVAGVITTLFFGGWQVPFLARDGFHFPLGLTVGLPAVLVVTLQVIAFLLKVVFFGWLQILIRWTLPRLRYDQLMWFGWKGMLPVSLFNVVATVLIVLLFQGAR